MGVLLGRQIKPTDIWLRGLASGRAALSRREADATPGGDTAHQAALPAAFWVVLGIKEGLSDALYRILARSFQALPLSILHFTAEHR